MKKKSFFGINVKLALMLVAICGMFASCYEKEELTVEAPSTVDAVYKIAGVVSNASTGAPLEGVKVNDATTAADGTYTLTAKEGLNVLKITKTDFKTVTTSIYVATIEKGQTAVYTANAAMYPGKDTPTYKTVKYNIKGTATDESGTAVALTSVVIPGLTIAPTGNTFTVEGIQPGTYYAVLTANGYKNAYATVNVAPVAAEEGEGDQIVTSVVAVLMQKEATAQVSKYFVCGFITNENNAGVSGATVKVEVGDFTKEDLTTDSRGYFNQEIPAEYVTPTTLAVITASKTGYIAQAKATILKLVESGATSVTSIEMVLRATTTDIPEEIPEIGGSTSDLVSDDAIQNAEKPKATDVVNDEAVEEEVKSGIEQVAKDLGIDLTNEETVIPVVTLETEILDEPLVSTEAVINEETGEVTQETKKVTDYISLPKNTQVYYVGGTPEKIKVSRDIQTEKATASVRTYEGKPNGAVFSEPLKITFVPSTTITKTPDYVFDVLYYEPETNKWIPDGNYATYQDKGFVAEIRHFSKFRFGFEQDITPSESTPLQPATNIDKPCYTGSASAIVTIKGQYVGGTAFEGNTPALAAEAALKGMSKETQNYITLLLKNMIMADNANIMPKNGYSKTEISADIKIDPYKQVNGFELTRNEVKKEYTIKVLKKGDEKNPIAVTVVVKKVVSATITKNEAIGHTHGHGNGEDLNAGGGIVEFE